MKAKKILSIFISLIMILGTMAVPAFAETTVISDVDTLVNELQISETNVLSADAEAMSAGETDTINGEEETKALNEGVYIGETHYATFAEAIAEASGDVTYKIVGDVELTDYTDLAPEGVTSVTIEGTGADTSSLTMVGTYRVRLNTGDANLTIKNIKMIDNCTGEVTAWEGTYFAPENAPVFTCENVTFEEGVLVTTGQKATFTNCTFDYVERNNAGTSHYMIFIDGDAEVTVDSCIFTDNCYRAVKICEDQYNEGKGSVGTVEVKNTEFGEISEKPAIVLTKAESVTLSGNDYGENVVLELDETGKSNGTEIIADITDISCKSDDYDDCGVLVNGKIYTTVTDAKSVAKDGDTVTLMYSPSDISETVELEYGVIVEANGNDAEGITTKAADVVITTAEGLFEWAENPGKGIVALGADIDLSGTEWTPISFGGKFDGQGYTIKNLTINKPDSDNVGFLTSVNSTFKNVTFENPTVTGRENVGVVAGRAGGKNSLVENVNVTGTIKVTGTHNGYARVGGIVGGWAYGTYKNITVDGTSAETSYIKWTGEGDGRYVAGIVGHADDVDAYINCTVKNITIDGGWLCGGIAGPGPKGGKLISGCAVENIKMDADASGGMFGWYYGNENSLIEDSSVKNVEFTQSGYRNGEIGGYGLDASVVVKNITTEGIVNYDDTELYKHGAAISDGIDTYYYVTLSDAIAKAEEGDTIKLLKNSDEFVEIPEGIEIEVNGFDYISGSGSKEDPYVISTFGALKTFRSNVLSGNTYEGQYITLGADMDLSAEYNWIPIGTKDAPFKGNFNGAGHKLSNLNRATSSDYAGLFGRVEGSAVIENFVMENVEIYSYGANVGAVAGSAFAAVTFKDITVTGDIEIRGTYKVGGIVGEGYFKAKNCHVIGNEGSTIKGEYYEAGLEGDSIGGIAGFIGEGNFTAIENCSVSGVTVTGTRKVGGVVGSAFQNNIITGAKATDVTVGTNADEAYAAENSKTMAIGGIVGLYNNAGANNGRIDAVAENITLTNKNGITVSAGYITGGLRGTEVPVAPVVEVISLGIGGTNSGANTDFLYESYAEVDGVAYTSLQAAVDAAEAGATITLLKDMEVSEQIVIDKAVTIDFANHTVTSTMAESGSKAVIINVEDASPLARSGAAVVTFKNGTLKATSDKIHRLVTVQGSVNFVTENMTLETSGHLNSRGNHNGAAVRNEAGTVWTAKAGTEVISNDAYTAAEVAGGTLNIEDGAIFMHRNSSMTEMGSAVGASYGGVVNVNGGTITSDKRGLAIYGTGGTLNVNAGTVNGVEAAIDVIIDTAEGVVNVTGGYLYGIIRTNKEADISLTGGWYETEPAADFVAADYEAIATGQGYVVAETASKTGTIEVQFTDDDADGIYDIVLASSDGKVINRLTAADLTFDNSASEVGYKITKKENSGVRFVPMGTDRYVFYFDAEAIKNDGLTTNGKITIGQVEFAGYGAVEFKVKADADNFVNATTAIDNVTDKFVTGGAKNLVIDGSLSTVKKTNELPTGELEVNLLFMQKLGAIDASAEYQEMTITIFSEKFEKSYSLSGNPEEGAAYNFYKVTDTLEANERYTLTIEAPGYRTVTHDFTLTEAGVKLTFWNNVMTQAQTVEAGKPMKNITFLAGDIVADDKMTVFDLSAVLSYIGMSADSTNAKWSYVQYDVNRDGKIDATDVSIVLNAIAGENDLTK